MTLVERLRWHLSTCVGHPDVMEYLLWPGAADAWAILSKTIWPSCGPMQRCSIASSATRTAGRIAFQNPSAPSSGGQFRIRRTRPRAFSSPRDSYVFNRKTGSLITVTRQQWRLAACSIPVFCRLPSGPGCHRASHLLLRRRMGLKSHPSQPTRRRTPRSARLNACLHSSRFVQVPRASLQTMAVGPNLRPRAMVRNQNLQSLK